MHMLYQDYQERKVEIATLKRNTLKAKWKSLRKKHFRTGSAGTTAGAPGFGEGNQRAANIASSVQVALLDLRLTDRYPCGLPRSLQ